MTGAEYLTFLGASIILALTPGPDTFLTLKFGTHHLRTGLIYTAAVTVGVIVWAMLALTGVAVLLEQFPGVRTGLTWVGGSYLIYLGISALNQVKRSRKAGTAAPALSTTSELPARYSEGIENDRRATAGSSGDAITAVPGASTAGDGTGNTARSVFRTGVISSLTNPKTGLFFLALLPPFLPQSPSPIDHTLLVATVAGCILLYGALLSAVADQVGRLLTARSGPIVIDAVAGVVLIILGITVVLI